jgi:methylenetetrahydrofolate reductase (NADPH)
VSDAGRPTLSFEFFPPSTDEGELDLWDTMRRLESLRPDFVSVTYGAGGSTRDRSVRLTERIARETTLTPVGHLTCVGARRSDLRQVIGSYAAAGVGTILALRGDPPGGPGQPWEPVEGGIDHAVELVRLVRESGDFRVGVAAFPDVHPAAISAEDDAARLVEKFRAGASFAITQFFFSVDSYARLLERVAAAGVDAPVIAGLMPVTNVGQITRFAQLSGTPFPAGLAQRLDAVADDPAAVRAIGVEHCAQLTQQVIDAGAPGVHFYTLNRSTATVEVARAVGLVGTELPH